MTVAGLAIGVTAIMMISAIGAGLSGLIQEQLERFDPSLLIVNASDTSRLGASPFYLRGRDSRLLRASLPQLRNVGAELRRPVRVGYEGGSHRTVGLGIDEGMAVLRGFEVAEGRNFQSFDHRSAARVALLGPNVTEELFGTEDPLGESVLIDGAVLEVVGVLAPEGAGLGEDPDDVVVMPLSTAQKRVLGKAPGRPFDEVSTIWLTFTANSTDGNKEAVAAALDRRAGSSSSEGEAFQIRSMEDQLAQVQDAVGAVRIGMSLVGSIAVFVAGIGILNTMLASIGERTREIGIRRAIGASKSDIRNQFVFEALCLSFVGGVIGIIVALIGVTLAQFYLPDWPMTIDLFSILGVMTIALVTGLVFGVIPAARASRLSPVDALKTL